jgi:hypothetical protein
MFRKSVLPPKLADTCDRDERRVAEEVRHHGCEIVAPTGLDVVADDRQAALFKPPLQYGCEAMKTGTQLMKPQPASRICSTYHFVAISEPTGR